MISISNVSKQFGAGPGAVVALNDVSLEVEKNEFITLLGPSGCGKTTLLRTVAGLSTPNAGSVTVDGKQVHGPSIDRPMVFQSFALLPWATVIDNIAFGLMLGGMKKREREDTAVELATMVGLAGFEKVRPAQLSGGMQQRVGLARALAVNPRVLLMDEPFGALDEQTKRVMQELLLKVWENERNTVMFVTHSIEEAILLADRVVVMSPRPGEIHRIVEVDLERPRTRKTELSARFNELKGMLWEELLNLDIDSTAARS